MSEGLRHGKKRGFVVNRFTFLSFVQILLRDICLGMSVHKMEFVCVCVCVCVCGWVG
jgi:hypothetical protein